MTEKIEFQLNKERMLEAVCWFANRSESNKITKHSLLKILFFADVAHINEHYFPIIGGHYVAMKYGPVHSELYNVLRNIGVESVVELPFKIEGNDIIAMRKHNPMKFSKASLTHLEAAWQKYGDEKFKKLTDLSHEHKSWKKAWEGTNSKNPPMDYEDFFEKGVDKEIIEDLRIHGKAFAV